MLAEISFVTQTTSGSSLNTDSATVSSTEARILTSEFSTLQTVETTRAGLIGCWVKSITVLTGRTRLADIFLGFILISSGFTVDLVIYASRTFVSLGAAN
jgi:hypothetical protein